MMGQESVKKYIFWVDFPQGSQFGIWIWVTADYRGIFACHPWNSYLNILWNHCIKYGIYDIFIGISLSFFRFIVRLLGESYCPDKSKKRLKRYIYLVLFRACFISIYLSCEPKNALKKTMVSAQRRVTWRVSLTITYNVYFAIMNYP